MKETILKILPYIIICLLVFFYIKSHEDHLKELALEKQNYLSQIKKLKKINDSTYQRYVFITDSLKTKLSEKDEKILAQNKVIVNLQTIIDNSTGVVIKDTVFNEVPFDCSGLRLGFFAENDFYTYSDTITIANPPTHKLSLSFKPFSIKTFLTRNNYGMWSGYLQLSGNVKNYITISDFSVEVEKDFYLGNISVPSYALVPYFSIVSDSKLTHFNLGVIGILSDRHLIGYGKSINSKFHTVMYGYKFNF